MTVFVGVPPRVEVEPERADVRDARLAHDHVVDRVGGVARQVGHRPRAFRSPDPTAATVDDRPSTRSATHRSDPSRDPTACRRRRRPSRAFPSPDRTRARRARACRRTRVGRRAIAGPSPKASPSSTTSVSATSAAQYRCPGRYGAWASSVVMGVDIGGTGIKGAPVDVQAGTLTGRAFPHPDAEARDAESGRGRGRAGRQPLRLERPGRQRPSRRS